MGNTQENVKKKEGGGGGGLRLHSSVHVKARPSSVVNTSAPLIKPTASGSYQVHDGFWSMFPQFHCR